MSRWSKDELEAAFAHYGAEVRAASATNDWGRFADEWRGRMPVIYRRRAVNTAFKAGNFWDFCQRWGNQRHADAGK